MSEVSEVLVPYSHFESRDLGRQMHEIVQLSADELQKRHLLGVVARYGASLDQAVEKIQKGQTDENPDHFAVVNEAGNVVGSASVYHDLPLHKLRLPLPMALAQSVPGLTVSYPFANPNIHAWTAAKSEEYLPRAYQQLANLGKSPKPQYEEDRRNAPWTVEPLRSPKYVHTALKMAGLSMVTSGRFDDGESRKRVPPISILYDKSDTEWLTARGRQKELRKGQWKSFWEGLMDDLNEASARYAGRG